MEKKDLVKLLDEIFIPLKFKRKSNNWVLNGNEISKIVNLQKSNFGNSFYLNYGYIINNLNLTTTTHVENRVASINPIEQKKITDLFDMDAEIDNEQRLVELKTIIIDKVVRQFQAIDTENDLRNHLVKLPHLNNIPLVVKKHFCLE